MSPNFATPAVQSLASYDHWVLWKREWRRDKDGRDVPTKPLYDLAWHKASHSNPNDWTTFERVLRAVPTPGHERGVGFVFAADDPFAGVDVDGCRDPATGEIAAWGQTIIDDLDSYTEVSPSGTGVKIVVEGTLPQAGRKTELGDVERISYKPPAIEAYTETRYFTITGEHLVGTPETIEPRQAALDALYARYFASTRDARGAPSEPPTDLPPSPGLTDAEVLELAFAARNGARVRALFVDGDISAYDDDDNRADAALCALLAFYTGGDLEQLDRLFRQSALNRDKWDRVDYRERTFRLAFARLTEVYRPRTRVDGVPEPEDIWTAPEFMHTARPSALATIEYVEGLIRPGRLIVLGAVEGTGKTYFVNELAIRFSAAGGKLGGVWAVVERGRVLMLSEMHRDDDLEYQERVLGALGRERSALGQLTRLSLASAAQGRAVFAVEGWVNRLIEHVQTDDVKLLIVDTVNGAIDGEPWGENLVKVFRVLRRILDECPGLALVLSTHMKKPGGRGGARDITDVIGQWTRSADVVLLLDVDEPGKVRLTTHKRLRRQVKVVVSQQDGLLVDPIPVGTKGKTMVDLEDIVAIVAENRGCTLEELRQLVFTRTGAEPAKATVGRWVQQLIRTGRLARDIDQSLYVAEPD